MNQRLLSPDHDVVPLHDTPTEPDAVHLFDARSMLAVNAALAANRPLLVRGEPGVGKSQLARAAAKALNRELKSQTLTIRTEIQDLFWTFDAVRRLAEAQVLGAISREHAEAGDESVASTIETHLAVERFVEPGPLWWAFDWARAYQQLTVARPKMPEKVRPSATAPNGVVVLLDEIDKADSSVPNGLLEALGQGTFVGPVDGSPIRQEGAYPLVVITTNEERTLPNAFLRRCLVLELFLPTKRDELIDHLVKRGRAHFEKGINGRPPPSEDVLEAAAVGLAEHRSKCTTPPRPGQAEYLDLLRAICELETDDDARQALIEDLAPLTLAKFQSRQAGRGSG